ncbi:hypothetical protein DWY02_06170 [Eubacterium sp. AF22-9]|nr:hypothetical protein DWY02_06170 [Eubacterium sp. AF22-9]
MILRVGGFFAFSGTVYIATLTKWINLCKRDKALAHFEGGYRSGYDGQKRKNEESFNHFKCITRYYIYTDIQCSLVILDQQDLFLLISARITISDL